MIVGSNFGYWIGRRYGLPLLQRFGARIGLDQGRIALGQYLFREHGGKIVFFGRFVAFLRVFAALLAGVNNYRWDAFLFYNAAGAIVWASLFGFSQLCFRQYRSQGRSPARHCRARRGDCRHRSFRLHRQAS